MAGKTKEQKAREEALVANQGDLLANTPPSPVDPDEKRAADEAMTKVGEKGDGPGATNEPR